MTPSIEQNVKARAAANDLVELGITLANEAGLSPDKVRRYWQTVVEIIQGLIDDEALCCKCGRVKRPATVGDQLPSSRLTDEDPFPFGKEWKGQRCGDVPDGFLEWFLRQPWCHQWPEVVEYAKCKD